MRTLETNMHLTKNGTKQKRVRWVKIERRLKSLNRIKEIEEPFVRQKLNRTTSFQTQSKELQPLTEYNLTYVKEDAEKKAKELNAAMKKVQETKPEEGFYPPVDVGKRVADAEKAFWEKEEDKKQQLQSLTTQYNADIAEIDERMNEATARLRSNMKNLQRKLYPKEREFAARKKAAEMKFSIDNGKGWRAWAFGYEGED